MSNNPTRDTLTDFLNIASIKMNTQIVNEYVELDHKCDEIISKIKNRKRKIQIKEKT